MEVAAKSAAGASRAAPVAIEDHLSARDLLDSGLATRPHAGPRSSRLCRRCARQFDREWNTIQSGL